jgi:hypothetical protein
MTESLHYVLKYVAVHSAINCYLIQSVPSWSCPTLDHFLHLLNNQDLFNHKQDRQCVCNVTLRCIRVTIFAVENACYECVYSCFIYPACKAHAPYFTAICGLSDCTIFFKFSSQRTTFSEKKVIEHKM